MPDLVRIYAAADIFILPTIYDPFSNACLEAVACGIPVITTRSNGFSEIIADGVHGSIVDSANDVAALRDAIRFWSDAARRATARSTNSECAAQFDVSKGRPLWNSKESSRSRGGAHERARHPRGQAVHYPDIAVSTSGKI
jgi:glycosyltransferase involved in cell wall biosynthesis